MPIEKSYCDLVLRGLKYSPSATHDTFEEYKKTYAPGFTVYLDVYQDGINTSIAVHTSCFPTTNIDTVIALSDDLKFLKKEGFLKNG